MSDQMGNLDRSESDFGWEPCPPGALVATAYRLRHRQAAMVAAARRKVVTAVVAIAAVVFGGGLAAWQVNERQQVVVLPPSRITCEETMALLERYLADDLSIAYESAICHHINSCPRCSTEFYRLQRDDSCDPNEDGDGHHEHRH